MNRRPKILFIVDVRNWAYDFRASKWKSLLEHEYDISILYLEDFSEKNEEPIFDQNDYDGIVFFYHRAATSTVLVSTPLDLNKVAICINNEKWRSDGAPYTYNKYFKGCKLLIGCNGAIIKAFSKYHNNIVRVSQVIDESLFFVDRKNITSSRSKKHFILGWCGNPDNPLKNIDWLNRACKELNITLSIADNLTQHNLNAWYNRIDAVACVSLQEGGPNMILEAGACKIPVITVPVGLSKELIINNETGLTVPSCRLDKLIKQIKRLSGNRILREKLANNLYKEVMENWTYTTRLYEIRNALTELVKE